ncbi:GNAT family N-acetyltransferase [Brevibacterium sp. CSND-B09]|uniref:GNAT family N-acetyltransferase n=1 Tax=unclassified Brevibacterium TaxID=2614124 RepID=UPI003463C40F
MKRQGSRFSVADREFSEAHHVDRYGILIVMAQDIDLRVRFTVDDAHLSALHARAFGHSGGEVKPWGARLKRHSLTWIGAFADDQLIGFVHACWDGGVHAFVLDTIVDPGHQRRGIGKRLVQTLVHEIKAAGCEWVHVDYEPHLEVFYHDSCGFSRTHAGLLRLASR